MEEDIQRRVQKEIRAIRTLAGTDRTEALQKTTQGNFGKRGIGGKVHHIVQCFSSSTSGKTITAILLLMYGLIESLVPFMLMWFLYLLQHSRINTKLKKIDREVLGEARGNRLFTDLSIMGIPSLVTGPMPSYCRRPNCAILRGRSYSVSGSLIYSCLTL